MRTPSNVFHFLLIAILSVALAVGPVVALAGSAPMPSRAIVNVHADAPCHEPCDDCGSDKHSSGCSIACVGQVAAVFTFISTSPLNVSRVRVGMLMGVTFGDRDDEPDKPPPKHHLA